jgi:hypothetical protein
MDYKSKYLKYKYKYLQLKGGSSKEYIHGDIVRKIQKTGNQKDKPSNVYNFTWFS